MDSSPCHSPVAIVTTPSESCSPYPGSRSIHEAVHHSPYMQKKRNLFGKWCIFSVRNIIHLPDMTLLFFRPANRIVNSPIRNIHQIQLLCRCFLPAPPESIQCISPDCFISSFSGYHAELPVPYPWFHNRKLTVYSLICKLENPDIQLILF